MISNVGCEYQAVDEIFSTSATDSESTDASDSDEDHSHAPSITSDLFEELSTVVNPLEESVAFGIDLYAAALEFAFSRT